MTRDLELAIDLMGMTDLVLQRADDWLRSGVLEQAHLLRSLPTDTMIGEVADSITAKLQILEAVRTEIYFRRNLYAEREGGC